MLSVLWWFRDAFCSNGWNECFIVGFSDAKGGFIFSSNGDHEHPDGNPDWLAVCNGEVGRLVAEVLSWSK